MTKIFVRAKAPLWYSKGFNPHAKLIFALPLSVGVQSECEYLDVRVERAIPPLELMEHITNAGSIFLGRFAPEALGDYMAGPNHTLPTSGTAKFSSPLSVDDFVKKSQYTYYTKEALGKVAEDIAYFARQEGLEAHARSALIRTKD